MQTHSRPCSLPNTSWPAWPCTAWHTHFVDNQSDNCTPSSNNYSGWKLHYLLKLTSAEWKIWNVLVREHSLVNHQVGQTAQARPTNDGHLRPLFSVGKKPVCRRFVLLILVPEGNRIAVTLFDECVENNACVKHDIGKQPVCWEVRWSRPSLPFMNVKYNT